VAGDWDRLGQVMHGFTHFELALGLARYRGANAALSTPMSIAQDGEWWPIDRLEQAGLPTVFAKAARLALAELEVTE
jgi:A/G-specific adenine glycosylase